MLAAGTIALSGTLAATAAPSSSRASGIEHFQFMSTSATATRDTVIAQGVFTAGALTSPPATHAEVPQRDDQAQAFTGHWATVLQPAYLPVHRYQHGTYTLLSGTGKYVGMSGHGRYRLDILAVGARSHGKCTQKSRRSLSS